MLNWGIHVNALATRTWSSLRALCVLGNSVHGLSCVSWQRIITSILLPILTYGAETWFTDLCQASYVDTFQVALNEACRKVGGIFRTTPSYLIHKLVTIPPIQYQLHHKLRLMSSRLLCAPPTYPLHVPSLIQGPSGTPGFLPLPEVYPAWSHPADSPLPFVSPPFPFEAHWSHLVLLRLS